MKPWTSLELEALRYLGPRLGGHETAAALERSYASVKMQAHRLGVRLRRSRDLETEVKLPASESLLERIRRLALASLCPSCAKRPASVTSTGLCAVCHHATRVAIAEEQIAAADGQLARWRARQTLQRRRKQLAAAESDESGDGAAILDAETANDFGEDDCRP